MTLNRKTKSHVYDNRQKRQNQVEIFFRIEKKQIKTVHNNSYG